MACRNAIIADFTIVLAGCIKSNAVPYHLGAGAGSKAAAMYQIKYAYQESVQISASASLQLDAQPLLELLNRVQAAQRVREARRDGHRASRSFRLGKGCRPAAAMASRASRGSFAPQLHAQMLRTLRAFDDELAARAEQERRQLD